MKEYKQGLLVDTDVEEEIELYKESIAEAKAPTSGPSTSVEQLATAAPTTANEIRPFAVNPFTSDGPINDPLEFEKTVKH